MSRRRDRVDLDAVAKFIREVAHEQRLFGLKAISRPTCERCKGEGRLPDGTPCANCEGRGWTIEVRI
jgi:DnaJ-class molecular chaperone